MTLKVIFAVAKHLLKRDTYSTRRTKEDIEGDEQIFFKNEIIIAVWVNQSIIFGGENIASIAVDVTWFHPIIVSLSKSKNIRNQALEMFNCTNSWTSFFLLFFVVEMLVLLVCLKLLLLY